MKIRNSFVSNSSSSSFLIYGTKFDNFSVESADCIFENISVFCPCDKTYVGRSWSGVKDDETGMQFKERTEKEIKEAISDFSKKLESPECKNCSCYDDCKEINVKVEDLKFRTYKEAWHD